MDELTESLSGKNSEIVNLKDELSQYKKEVIPIKKNDRSNSANEKSNQNKAPNKEKEILNMLNKQLEEIENKANIKDDKRRNQSEGLSSAERIRPQENEKKPVFQSYDFNERNRHSENINVKGWDSTKLRQTYNSEKYDEAFEDDFIENAYKKPNKSHKSVDNEIKIKPSEPKEIRDSSNLEDLQKKLNILKNKRMEFEKRKSV